MYVNLQCDYVIQVLFMPPGGKYSSFFNDEAYSFVVLSFGIEQWKGLQELVCYRCKCDDEGFNLPSPISEYPLTYLQIAFVS